MKIIKPALLSAIVIAVIVFITANTLPMEKDYDDQWKKVDSLVNLRQPRSALEIVDEIYQLSKSENNTPQAIKANLYRIRLISEFEEDHLVKAIQNIQEEITTAEFPEKQLLHSILGDLYMRYFQMNSYQILERGRLLNIESEDIQTWDAHKLLTAAGEHFEASLEPVTELQQTGLAAFSAILDEKKDSKLYRPTLFDLLAHRAIGFYSSSQSGITVAADQFKPDKPQYFSPVATFTKIRNYRKRNRMPTQQSQSGFTRICWNFILMQQPLRHALMPTSKDWHSFMTMLLSKTPTASISRHLQIYMHSTATHHIRQISPLSWQNFTTCWQANTTLMQATITAGKERRLLISVKQP